MLWPALSSAVSSPDHCRMLGWAGTRIHAEASCSYAPPAGPSHRRIACRALPGQQEPCEAQSDNQQPGRRRQLLLGTAALLSGTAALRLPPAAQALDSSAGEQSALSCRAASTALLRLPAELRSWRDRIDGYQFTFPRTWFPVTARSPASCAQRGSQTEAEAHMLQSSGNDIFFRNPADVDENLFVSISSPSTSKFESVEDLGGPDAAAERTLRQYLEELKTTRLGVKRSGDVVSASSRMAQDGRVYYDLQVSARLLA